MPTGEHGSAKVLSRSWGTHQGEVDAKPQVLSGLEVDWPDDKEKDLK